MTRDDILATGLKVLREEGLEAVSLREIASRLGVRAPSLYWHVANKADLLSLMATSFYTEAIRKTAATADWRTWLRRFGNALRNELHATPDSARLCMSAGRPPLDSHSFADWFAKPIEDAGLNRSKGLQYQSIVISFAVGWMVFEQSRLLDATLQSEVGFADSFDIGLEAIVIGLPG